MQRIAESSRRRISTDHGALPSGIDHICDDLLRLEPDSKPEGKASTAPSIYTASLLREPESAIRLSGLLLALHQLCAASRA